MDQHFLFYVAPDDMVRDRVWFSEEEARHIAKVLRKRPGDVIQATDGCGGQLDVRLDVVSREQVAGEILRREVIQPGPERILLMGVIRQRDRLEFAVEKAVELGVSRIVLVHSDHTEKTAIKAARIEKIILSALKQSRRFHLPEWEERGSFLDALTAYGANRNVILAHPEQDEISGESGTGKGSLQANAQDVRKPGASPAVLMVGPEGGFSDREVEHAMASGAVKVSLGPARLRTETAVCTLLSWAAETI